MFSDPVLLEELLQTTKDLIDFNSFQITLLRGGWTRVPGGGQRQEEPVAQPVQKLYFGAVMYDPRMVVTIEGEQVIANYVLIGLPGADIKEKDLFSVGTQTFKVVEVHPDTSYEVRAWVTEKS